ncbi:hypothetical protein AMTRI_Chr09g22160 [Amborella trichopoda]
MTTKPSPGNDEPFVDIHELYTEEVRDKEMKPDKYCRIHKDKGQHHIGKNHHHHHNGVKFTRQVSLETGFSVFGNCTNKEERRSKLLTRSGNSFGEFRGAARVTDVRRGEFNLFRTKTTLSRQNSLLPLRKLAEQDVHHHHPPLPQAEEDVDLEVPAGRYFAALQGPELDEVKDSEDILLPKDELWPFLLRFPIGCFGICLGLGSQAILWNTLSTSPATRFLHIPPYPSLALWLLALMTLIVVSFAYILKSAFYLEAVRREYYHPVRGNFFFAPWIASMFLAIAAPPLLTHGPPHPALWCVLMTPVFLLEVKVYGQWLSGGKRRLCMVANPSSHLSVVGNFVGAILAAKVGWEEAGKFFWAVGFAHYLVVFVTLYQRLPTSHVLPKELHPVYSMFITAPGAASVAWEAIYGEFDGMARTCFFVALFLYLTLVVRINFFRGFRFSVAWWSYTFPMTTASVATIKYAEQEPCVLSQGLAVALSALSTAMVSVLLVSTLLHAFIWGSLFPNDYAIAITRHKVGVKGKAKTIRKAANGIKRWTRSSSLALVSSVAKNPFEKDASGGKV